jgi:hypothetical protein
LLALLALPWLVHTLVVLLSALGARPLASMVAVLAILAAAAAFAAALGKEAWEQGDGAGAARTRAEGLVAWSRASGWALSAAGALSFLIAVTLAVALPTTAYDALAYRLPVIAQWLDAGRIAWVSSDDPVRNGYPLGQEAVSAVVAAASGSLRFACATSFVHLASGAAAIWLLAEACSVRRALARSAAAIFVLVPMVILNAPSGYVDAAFAGATVALLCSAALLAESRSGPLLAAATGMAAANVLALKGTGVLFVAIAGAGVLACVGLRRVRSGVAGVRPLSMAIALACTAPGAFWLLRDVAHTGNPLWPVTITLAGHTIFHGVGSVEQILDTAHNTPADFASVGELGRLLRTWLELSGPAVDFDDRMAGLGLAWPLIALPAIAMLCLGLLRNREQRARCAPIALLLLLTLGCFAVQPMRWWSRYTLWVWGAGALAIALQAERLATSGRARLLALYLAALTALCVGEGALALTHAKDAKIALARWLAPGGRHAQLSDPRHALNAASWVAPEFWALGIERRRDVCRGWWKPGTDNANLDGVLAQLRPRPRVHVVDDDHQKWPQVRAAWRAIGCAELLLLNASPVVPFAKRDAQVRVERAVAFDPIFIVRPRTTVALGHFGDLQP